MFFVNAVVHRLRDGWEAWVAFGPTQISTNKLPTKEEATNNLTERLVSYGEILHNTVVEIRWFDPNRHFSHCDAGYLYDENGNTNKFCTFLSYKENDKAEVMVSDTGETLLIDPADLKPIKLSKPW